MDFADTPALAPPSGVVPNFENPENRGYQLVITSAICLSLAMTFTIGRIYAKIFVLRLWDWDDYAVIFAMIGTIIYTALCIVPLHLGYGVHQWNDHVSIYTPHLLKIQLVTSVMYGAVIYAVKLSLLLLYLQLFSLKSKTRHLIFFGIVFLGLFYAGTTVSDGIICGPSLHMNWTQTLKNFGRCNRATQQAVVVGIVNVVSDFYILILPIPTIMHLQLPKQKKVGVLAILTTGFLACISSIVGLVYRVRLNETRDITWAEIPVLTTGIAEMNVGVVCACMPSFASLIRYLFPRTTDYTSVGISESKKNNALHEPSYKTGASRVLPSYTIHWSSEERFVELQTAQPTLKASSTHWSPTL